MMYLLNGECLSWCPAGYAWNNLTRVCDLCPLLTYSFAGSCLTHCPTLYLPSEGNRSCVHISATGLQLNLTLKVIDVLPHGKLLRFTLNLQDGLDQSSQNWVLRKSYFRAQILYRNAGVGKFTPVRNLVEVNLPVRNLNYQNGFIYYYTLIPDGLDYRKSFSVNFLDTIRSVQGIEYAQTSNTISVFERPEILRQYFSYCVRNYYNTIAIPLFILLLLFIGLRIVGTYELLIESVRVVQMLGLLVYSAFPVGPYLFYFLTGLNYANLDFVPNLYAMFTDVESQSALNSFLLFTNDMEFLRLNASVILFSIVWTIFYLILKFLVKV